MPKFHISIRFYFKISLTEDKNESHSQEV